MKITYEFNTNADDFEYAELHAVEDAQTLVHIASKVLDLARYYEKYDNRESIPVDELVDRLRDLVCDNVRMERYGY